MFLIYNILVKFIKSYKIFESINLELKNELLKFSIFKYSINEDGSIDCHKNVSFFMEYLNKIPFNFNKVNGYFSIHTCELKSLKNCPKYISDYFDCSNNKLESLEYGPEYVGGDYNCLSNKLTTLKGCVDEVYGNFNCSFNKLTSLEFCPMEVNGNFDCSENKLEYLDRSPFIKGSLFCTGMFKTKPEFNGYCKKLFWK